MTYALAAAGTGGHIYPAIAVADALVGSGVPREEIVFFGGDRLAPSVVPAAGYDLVRLPLRGLRRSLSLQNLTLPLVVWRASRMVAAELRRRATRVLMAFGGYVTVPAGWGARAAGVPVFLHEQNAEPGLANRLVARFAEATFAAFDSATAKLPGAEVVGNPMRPAFSEFDREALRASARREYGLPDDAAVLGVLGGSQGALVLNRTATEFARHDAAAIVHLAGTGKAEEVRHAATELRRGSGAPWVILDFESNMERFYAASDLVLSRAGALTVSELAATGTPSVVVPLAIGTAGHQAANALSLVTAGGAVMVDEAELESVPKLLTELLHDPARLESMAAAARSVGKPGAARLIAARLMAAVEV